MYSPQVISFLLIEIGLLASGVASSSAYHGVHRRATSGVSNSAADADGKTFDYIVVGGGLTGTTVASRLSENPGVKVLLVEVGPDKRKDPLVYDFFNWGNASAADSEINWSWPTEEGRHISGGKVLGGSSSINGAAYTRGVKEQYDAWSLFLEPSEAKVGWNWNGLFSYMKKAEKFNPPTADQASRGAQYVPSYHGSEGPVSVSFPQPMWGGPQQIAFANTVSNVTGLDFAKDVNGGRPNCVSVTPLTLRANSSLRCSSADAYLTPVESDRPNWLTLTEHMVTKINWTNSTRLPITASGIEFAPSSGGSTRYTAKATKEVILAAGAIQTPALLQLSGVGDSELLSSLGITTRLNLKTVGRNLQEQTLNLLGSSGNGFDLGGPGINDLIAFPNLYQVLGNKSAPAVSKIKSSLQTWAKAQVAESGYSVAAFEKVFAVQADLILNKKAPTTEFFYLNVEAYPGIVHVVSMWNLLPFSRGYVRINTTDPFTYPTIHVNYFAADIDLDLQVGACRLLRRIFSSPPLSNLSDGETVPGSLVPDNGDGGSDADWKAWIEQNFTPNHHPIGTASMMRRDLGGVVDAHLKVYDTTNVRVVDASIMPMQISAHMSATLYGVAEKAADLIKASPLYPV